MPKQTYADRRADFAAKMPPSSIAFLASNTEARRSNDTDFKYRPDSSFFYMTGFAEPMSAMVLVKDASGALSYELFVRPKDPDKEIWDGKRAGIEGALKNFGADKAHSVDEIDQIMPELLLGKEVLYCRLGDSNFRNTLFSGSVDPWLSDTLKKNRGDGVPATLIDINPILYEMRLIKSPFEIAQMQTAARISCEAHKCAMKYAKPGMLEYALEGELLYVMQRAGCQVAYNSIVAGGKNACILHYTENNEPLSDGELVLIDAGAEYQYYAADITRTFPVNGRFSEPQRQIYEVVLKAQLAAIEQMCPGNLCRDYHRAAIKVLTQGLVELGILSGDVAELIKDKAYLRYYMHGTGHWLGMDVHDVGSYSDPEKSVTERALAPGMVLTVEPGLYIPPDDQGVPAQYRGIGVRIEDDVLITESGHRVLSADVPKTVEGIETLMQSAREKLNGGAG